MQYLAIVVVLEWASVLRVIEVHGTEEEHSKEIALAKSEARECFSHCRLYLSVAEEQLMGYKLGTNTSIFTYVILSQTPLLTSITIRI
jgi:hypothetical protein